MLDPREVCVLVSPYVFPFIDYTVDCLVVENFDNINRLEFVTAKCVFPWSMALPTNMRINTSSGNGRLTFYKIEMKAKCPCPPGHVCAMCHGTRSFKEVAHWYLEGGYLTALSRRPKGKGLATVFEKWKSKSISEP